MKLFVPIVSVFLLLSCHQKTWEERCLEEAANITFTQCPKDMGNGIVMDSITYEAASNSNTYYYSVNGEMDNDSLFQQEQESFKALLLSQIANSIDLKEKKDHGTIFRYIYTSETTKSCLLDCSFGPSDIGSYVEK